VDYQGTHDDRRCSGVKQHKIGRLPKFRYRVNYGMDNHSLDASSPKIFLHQDIVSSNP